LGARSLLKFGILIPFISKSKGLSDYSDRLLAREMSDRSTQMLVVAALKEASKAENAQPVKSASTAGFPPDKEQLWQSMFSSWLVAVSAQGSVAGFSALAELLIRPAAGKALRRAGNIVEHRLAFAH
jgi:hypothetical protein